MPRAAAVAVILGLLAGRAGIHAQPAYSVRLNKAGPGATLRVEKQEVQRKQVQVQDRTGKTVQDRSDGHSDTVVYRETILAREPGQDRPTHLLRTFERAQRQISGRTIEVPVRGKAVDIEKKGGRYQFRYADGEALPAEALPALDNEFNSGLHQELNFEQLIQPAGPARVGEAWELDRARLVKVLGKLTKMDFDAEHATARATLVRVYPQEGRPFAVLEADVELPVKASLRDNTIHPLLPGSRITLKLRMDGCTDGGAEAGTVEIRLQMTGSSLMKGPDGSVVTMKVSYQAMIKEKRREVKPESR
jgi:hypothetical protein